MDLLGPQGHPPDGPESPNPDPDREIRFFENPDFSIFRLFKLKDPTTWVSIDSPGCFLLIALLNCPLNKLINFGGYDLYIISTEYYPSEPERAAEARRAVVASICNNKHFLDIFLPHAVETDRSTTLT